MSEYEEGSKLALQQIKDDRVYLEPIERRIGGKMHYDFLICGMDGRPILCAGIYIYDSEEDALYGGKILALRTQQQGLLEKLAA